MEEERWRVALERCAAGTCCRAVTRHAPQCSIRAMCLREREDRMAAYRRDVAGELGSRETDLRSPRRLALVAILIAGAAAGFGLAVAVGGWPW